jgi:hypothetical protein
MVALHDRRPSASWSSWGWVLTSLSLKLPQRPQLRSRSWSAKRSTRWRTRERQLRNLLSESASCSKVPKNSLTFAAMSRKRHGSWNLKDELSWPAPDALLIVPER